MFGLSSIAVQLIGAAFAVLVAFSGGFGLEWHMRNGDDAQAQLARDAAEVKAIIWQSQIAQQQGAAGQKLADDAGKAFAVAKAHQDGATQGVLAYLAKHPVRTIVVAAPAPKSPASNTPETTNANSMPPPSDSLAAGFVRFHDAAASGSPDPAGLSAAVPGADDASSGVDVPQFESVLAANYGAARSNAAQLSALEKWAADVRAWYADLRERLAQPAK